VIGVVAGELISPLLSLPAAQFVDWLLALPEDAQGGFQPAAQCFRP